jgi:cytochrome c oxidase cbb3-type subunit 3
MIQKSVVVSAILGIALTSSRIGAQDLRGNPDRGEAVYKAHCLRCHGRMGDGNGPEAGDLIVRPSNFHTLQFRAKSDLELLVAISNGVLFSPMHSWRGRTTDEDMLDVIRYIRALAPQEVMSMR